MAAADSPIDLDNDELPPLALKINPFEVEFFKTRLTSNPVVEDTKSGGFVINLGHRPGFRVGRSSTHRWGYKKNLKAMTTGENYRSEAEAGREVFKQMLILEGFVLINNSHWSESDAMALARQVEEKAALASSSSSGVSASEVAMPDSGTRPLLIGRPLGKPKEIVVGVSASNDASLKRFAELAFRTRSVGGNNGRAILNRGRQSTANEAKRAAAELAREARKVEAEAFRVIQIARLYSHLKRNDLQSLVFNSPQLVELNDGEPLPLSDAGAARVRSQAHCVAILYTIVGERHECSLDSSGDSLTLKECCELAYERSGFQAAGTTIYDWHLDFMENGGKFKRDARGTFERDTYIKENVEVLGKFKLWCIQHKHLTKRLAAEFINQTLIPEHYPGKPFEMTVELRRFGLKYPISDFTVLQWMHEAGGEKKKREKTYMHDKHEHEETRHDRKLYVLRDLGKSPQEPSDRYIRQHHWVQMTREAAEKVVAQHPVENQAHLWSIAYHYKATSAAAKGSVDADGFVTGKAAAAYAESASERFETAVAAAVAEASAMKRQRTALRPDGTTAAVVAVGVTPEQRSRALAEVHESQLAADGIAATPPAPNTTEVQNVFEFETTKCTMLEGQGDEVAAGSWVEVHLRGEVVSTGRAAFWDTKGQAPLEFEADAGGVTRGLDKGCLGMKAGEKRVLIIPPQEGYGTKGFPGLGVPGGATLRFTVDCVSVKGFCGVGAAATGAVAADATAAAGGMQAAATVGLAAVGSVDMVEWNVEDSAAFEDWREEEFFGGNVSVRAFGLRPMMKLGQDEAIWNSEVASADDWYFDGKHTYTPKSGNGLMASAFTCIQIGFGLPVTPAQLQSFNEWRQKPENCEYKCAKFGAPQKVRKDAGLAESTTKPWLSESPGLRIIQHGKGHDGYWNGEHQMVQTEDVSDLVHCLFPECYILQEYDRSGCHGTKKKNALDAMKMGASFGGAQSAKRDTIVTPGCLGLHPAVITLADGSTVDRKLKPGETQSMVFLPGDPPPFYAPDTPEDDVDTGKTKALRAAPAVKKSRVQMQMSGVGPGAEDVPVPEEEPAVMEVVLRPGYVGAQKGLLDVAFERGLLDPVLLASKKGHKSYSLDGPVVDGVRDKKLSLRALVGNCEDFLEEVTAMYELVVELLGDGFEQTPKGHPELAGDGIEYCWGKGKMHFRRTNNYDPNVARFEARVRQSLCTQDRRKEDSWTKEAMIAVLPPRRVRKYRRKANEYKKTYRIIDNKVDGEEGDSVAGGSSYADVEKLRSLCKIHRCTEHQDHKFLTEN